MNEAEALERLRGLCSAYPDTVERPSHGSPTWFAGGKRVFATYVPFLHGSDRIAVWMPAAPGIQQALVEADPAKFYKPPYVGPSGWIGMYLDVPVDWEELAGLLDEAFFLVAPKRLAHRIRLDRES